MINVGPWGVVASFWRPQLRAALAASGGPLAQSQETHESAAMLGGGAVL